MTPEKSSPGVFLGHDDRVPNDVTGHHERDAVAGLQRFRVSVAAGVTERDDDRAGVGRFPPDRAALAGRRGW